MTAHTKTFGLALLISFFGSLPIGTLNATVTSLFINRGTPHAAAFALAAVAVEIVTVCIAIAAVQGIEKLNRFVRVFQAVAVLVLLAFAYISLTAAFQKETLAAALPMANTNPWLAGLLLSAINPLHIPFWMGWATILKTRGIFRPTSVAYTAFAAAAGLGTLLAFGIYAWGGTLLLQILDGRQHILNGIIGITMLITAIIQLYRIHTAARPAPIKHN